MRNLIKLWALSFLGLPVALWAGADFGTEIAALETLDAWQDAVAGNMATRAPGSKRTIISIQSNEVSASDTMNPLKKSTRPQAIVSRDFTQGPMRHTGVPTHVGINGDEGFFSIDGGKTLTRDGEFQWDSNNTLIDKLGRSVDGTSGPIAKTPSSGPVSIDSLGNIYQNGESIGQLKIVKVEDKTSLHLVEGGFALVGGNAIPFEEARVAPEFLEGTNNKAISGMTDMIKITRSYEAVVQAMSQKSESIGRAISFLGR